MLTFTLKKENRGLKELLVIHLVITVICTIAALRLFPENQSANFILGQSYAWVSLLSLSFSVYLFFLKKNIALLVSVIVFKWPILVYVVYKMTEKVELSPGFLSTGFMPVIVSALIWSFMQKE